LLSTAYPPQFTLYSDQFLKKNFLQFYNSIPARLSKKFRLWKKKNIKNFFLKWEKVLFCVNLFDT
jgi:hypothetical protein